MLSDEGIYAGILLMPILPFINDTEENIVNIVRKAMIMVQNLFLLMVWGLHLEEIKEIIIMKN